MLLKMNSSSNKGYLYQFCPNWEGLDSMVNSGELWLSKYSELSWQKGKGIERNEETKTRFASLTRSPGVIIEAKSSKWRFAVILDSRFLTSKYKIKPYSYFFRPGVRSYVLEEYSGENGGKPHYLLAKDGNVKTDGVELSKQEGDEIVRWLGEAESAGYAKVKEEVPKQSSLSDYSSLNDILDIYDLDDLDDMFGSDEDPDLVVRYYFDIHLGTDESHDTESNLKYLPVTSLPKPLYRVASRVLTESEERLYPHKRDKHWEEEEPWNPANTKKKLVYNDVDIKKAIVGVLIPDSAYFTSDRIEFEEEHPDLPIYIYRDPWMGVGTYPQLKLKHELELNPEVKQLYRLPR